MTPEQKRLLEQAIEVCQELVGALKEPGISINKEHEVFDKAYDVLLLWEGKPVPYRGKRA